MNVLIEPCEEQRLQQNLSQNNRYNLIMSSIRNLVISSIGNLLYIHLIFHISIYSMVCSIKTRAQDSRDPVFC